VETEIKAKVTKVRVPKGNKIKLKLTKDNKIKANKHPHKDIKDKPNKLPNHKTQPQGHNRKDKIKISTKGDNLSILVSNKDKDIIKEDTVNKDNTAKIKAKEISINTKDKEVDQTTNKDKEETETKVGKIKAKEIEINKDKEPNHKDNKLKVTKDRLLPLVGKYRIIPKPSLQFWEINI